MYCPKRCDFECCPGWNENVDDMYVIVRCAFVLWNDQGKPLQDLVFEMKKED